MKDYTDPVLPVDSEERKQIPIFSGFLNYFPLAVAAVARWSKRGNDKHNPGQPLHWSRGKSADHEDCIARHLIDVETLAPSGEYEDAVALAWRALAKLQELEERRLGKAPSRGSKTFEHAPVEARVEKADVHTKGETDDLPEHDGMNWEVGWFRAPSFGFGCVNECPVGCERRINAGERCYGTGERGGILCEACAPKTSGAV